MTGAVAKRYARALASIAKEQNGLETIGDELNTIAASFSDPEVANALSAPVLSHEARRGLLAQITATLNLSELTRNFLELLADRHRLSQLPGIVHSYQAIVDQELGRLRATLRVASSLPDAVVESMCSALEQTYRKKILLSVEIDPGLVAGATLEIEGRIYDGSARTQLAHITQAMSREPTSA